MGVFVAAVAFAASSGAAQASSVGTRNDEEAVKAVIAATTDAFTRHDAKAWVKFCTPDAQLVTVCGKYMRGPAEIEKGLTRIFETRGKPCWITDPRAYAQAIRRTLQQQRYNRRLTRRSERTSCGNRP